MYYYREIKDGKVLSYQQHLNRVNCSFLEELSENEYNQAVCTLEDKYENFT